MTALEQALAEAEAAGIRQERHQVGDLHANVARLGRGRPLLLLHGWPEFWLVWRPVMERLADAFELIAPDLRGCGDTGKPTPGPDATATADRHAEDMLGLMDALGFQHFGVVSGDLGAYVAQAMSHRAPERLEGTFYFCTPYPGLGPRYGQPSHLVEVWYQLLSAAPLDRGAGRQLARGVPALFQALPGSLVRRQPDCVRGTARGLRGQLHEAGQHPGRLRLVSQLRPEPPAVVGRQAAAQARDHGADALPLGPT
jgi:pimeloyl-ACP methyl ester carboxylesterase